MGVPAGQGRNQGARWCEIRNTATTPTTEAPTTRSYGAGDGYGRYGILDRDDEGLLLCHECGRWWRHLATHVHYSHNMTAAAYREAHGLSTGTRLVSSGTSERMRTSWERNRDLHLSVLEGTRDPDAARTQQQAGSQWRPELVARRMAIAASRRTDLTPEQVAELGDITDLRGWADRVRRLVARDGVSLHAVARATGLSLGGVQGRLRRYP